MNFLCRGFLLPSPAGGTIGRPQFPRPPRLPLWGSWPRSGLRGRKKFCAKPSPSGHSSCHLSQGERQAPAGGTGVRSFVAALLWMSDLEVRPSFVILSGAKRSRRIFLPVLPKKRPPCMAALRRLLKVDLRNDGCSIGRDGETFHKFHPKCA